MGPEHKRPLSHHKLRKSSISAESTWKKNIFIFIYPMFTEECYKPRLKPRCRPPTLPTLGPKSTVWGSASARWTARCHVLEPRRWPKKWQANIVLRWRRHRSKNLMKRGDWCRFTGLCYNIAMFEDFVQYRKQQPSCVFCCKYVKLGLYQRQPDVRSHLWIHAFKHNFTSSSVSTSHRKHSANRPVCPSNNRKIRKSNKQTGSPKMFTNLLLVQRWN